VQRAPRFAGVRADYERVLKQRSSLLKQAGHVRRSGGGRGARTEGALATLGVWDTHLAATGAELLAARLTLVDDLRPYVGAAYAAVARGAATTEAAMTYKASFELPGLPPGDRVDRDVLAAALLAEVERRRDDEIDRGLSLVGPHRDDLVLSLGPLPMRGYASHGESWSMALALRLASYELLRSTGDDPILILDDVFAELDTDRRDRLAELVADAEQVLVTAAVPDDIPAALAGVRIEVVDGKVLPGVA
jgi:DNA replication and repair protein RecF